MIKGDYTISGDMVILLHDKDGKETTAVSIPFTLQMRKEIGDIIEPKLDMSIYYLKTLKLEKNG